MLAPSVFKAYDVRGIVPDELDTGLDTIKLHALGPAPPMSETRGTVTGRDVYAGFHDRALSFIDPGAVRPLTVVLDGANGMAGPMIGPILERLPVRAIP